MELLDQAFASARRGIRGEALEQEAKRGAQLELERPRSGDARASSRGGGWEVSGGGGGQGVGRWLGGLRVLFGLTGVGSWDFGVFYPGFELV